MGECMRYKLWRGILLGLLIVLTPCIITMSLNGGEHITDHPVQKTGRTIIRQTEHMDLEEYLLGAVAAYIPSNYEDEMLKVQAVILRSYIRNVMGAREEVEEEELGLSYLEVAQMEQMWGEAFSDRYQRLKKAVTDTTGEVLYYNEAVIEPYFHQLSAGSTNRIKDAEYLQSVESKGDVQADQYLVLKIYTVEEFQQILKEKLQISVEELLTDSSDSIFNHIECIKSTSDYIEAVKIQETVITPEQFTEAFELCSFAFSIEEYNEKIRIITKGIGHGFGVSLYGGNEMARNGKNYREILEYYYSNITLSGE